MSTCHDPYKELELYLKKAEEEIGKAVEELQRHEEETSLLENNVQYASPNTSTLPSPKTFPFRMVDKTNRDVQKHSPVVQRLSQERLDKFNKPCESLNSQNRELYSRSARKHLFSNICSTSSYSNGKPPYSPNTKKRLWQMHPSLSFPETSKDLLMLTKTLEEARDSRVPSNYKCNNISSKGRLNGYLKNFPGSEETTGRRFRQRSCSETSPPTSKWEKNHEPFLYSRPPSGDVNLLSIWADNLVLEIDKSFSEELNSGDSFSPSSDYSLSPAKQEDSLEEGAFSLEETSKPPGTPFLEEVSSSNPSGNLKLVSFSPDSGIEHVSCTTPEGLLDSVDSNAVAKTWGHEGLSSEYELLNSFPELDHITPPPPEFEDNIKPVDIPNATESLELSLEQLKNVSSLDFEGNKVLRTANNVVELPDSPVEHTTKDIEELFRAIPLATLELEECAVLSRTCAISEPPSKDPDSANCASGDKVTSSFSSSDVKIRDPHEYYSLQKPTYRSHKVDKWSSSLPRDAARITDVTSPQRSASSSAVSSIPHVSIDELAAFMRGMKTTSESKTSHADVSTNIKEDDENKDAVTQTTPLPLSRSSSLTSTTECNCNEWDKTHHHGGSEDSLLVEHCSVCKAEKLDNHQSSSSSLGISSDDDNCEPATPCSGCSSLYLSACSGSSDSFDENNVKEPKQELSETLDSEPSLPQNQISFRGSDSTLRPSTLGDISEEQAPSETFSITSTISNPSLEESNANDSQEQSASFPCTLKPNKKNKSIESPAQPIEPKILIINELNLKSISAPVLRQKRSKVPESSSSESSPPTGNKRKDASNLDQVPARAHSAKEINELQAIEACSWLRAAGFPQYAQMYEDNLFPIDICTVQKDHAFLHPDSIQSLFRRLNTLNRCAKMKFMDNMPRKSLCLDESDDEEQCALSENWQFQGTSKRWSRIVSPSDVLQDATLKEPTQSLKPSPAQPFSGRKFLSPEEAYCSSHDSVFVDEQQSSPESIRHTTIPKFDKTSLPIYQVGDGSPGSSSGSGGTLSLTSVDIQDPQQKNLRRSGSDRVKEGAKALLRRMESLKGKKKKKVSDTNNDNSPFSPKSRDDGSPSSSIASSPRLLRTQHSYTPETTHEASSRLKQKDILCQNVEDKGAHSDSECPILSISEQWKDANSNDTKPLKHFISSQDPSIRTNTSSIDQWSSAKDYSKIKKLQCKYVHHETKSIKKSLLCPSVSLEPHLTDNHKRNSYYDNLNAPIVVFNDLCTESIDNCISLEEMNKSENLNTYSENNPIPNQDGEIIILSNERRDSGVGSSLTRGISYQQAPWQCFLNRSSSLSKTIATSLQINDLSAPQILLLRKLSLLKLTTVMEKFSPSSRTGWSWAVPKFIRRIRTPDYKDKVVFGVPLLLVLQRTGHSLPTSIQAAIHYLRNTSLDSTGLFRKSGVRSRIQKLKLLHESNPDKINYQEQQAYDIADMLKQYFRELPEALLTNKLSEIFISIFQYIPEDLRLEAIQSALMLMPDENREVLQSLLGFLHEVCQHSEINQMTATNLAVCFAPSLFHLSSPRSASSSPRRRKTVGVPDLRELNENRAAYECLSCMVTNYKTLFSVSEEMISQNRISAAGHFEPATLEELSSLICNGQGGWRSYVDSCIQVVMKEAKDKYKGWVNVSQSDHVDLAYKKLSDGHPLRLWKVSTEIEAPPVEVLNRILRERQVWDSSFIKWKVITRLNKQTEIFQYLNSSLPPHPPRDYCILRSWKTDLPKGTCVLIETSINHIEAKPIPGSVRAITLASRYLIEPCGSGKSRVTHISRVDMRGRSPEWYNRAYGHICSLSLIKLRNSFTHTRTNGPETKV